MLLELVEDVVALQELVLDGDVGYLLLPDLQGLLFKVLVNLLDSNPLGAALYLLSVVDIPRNSGEVLGLNVFEGYFFRS